MPCSPLPPTPVPGPAFTGQIRMTASTSTWAPALTSQRYPRLAAPLSRSALRASVGAVHSKVRSLRRVVSTCMQMCSGALCTHSNIGAGIAGQEGDGTHQVLRASHFTDGDQRSPLLLQIWVVVKNLLGSVALSASIATVGRGCSYSAVSMYPGEMQFTRMPAPAHSTAKLDARCRTAALAAL